MNLKEEIAALIRQHNQYFSDGVTRSSDEDGDWQTTPVKYLEEMKEAERIAKEIGVCVYVNDLHECTYAPVEVKNKLPILIEKYGRENVVREIAKQMSGFGQLSDNDIINICRNICRNFNTEEGAIDEIKKRFNVGIVVLCFSEPNEAGQKMVMGNINGPKGNVISF